MWNYWQFINLLSGPVLLDISITKMSILTLLDIKVSNFNLTYKFQTGGVDRPAPSGETVQTSERLPLYRSHPVRTGSRYIFYGTCWIINIRMCRICSLSKSQINLWSGPRCTCPYCWQCILYNIYSYFMICIVLVYVSIPSRFIAVHFSSHHHWSSIFIMSGNSALRQCLCWYSGTWELGTLTGLWKTALNSEVVLFLMSISVYWIGLDWSSCP